MSHEEFNDKVQFVTQDKYFLMKDGFTPRTESSDFDIYVWNAGDDNDQEGTFLNYTFVS